MLSRTIFYRILNTRSYQELTLPSQVLLFLLIHVLLSSLLPRQKQQSVKVSPNQWVHGEEPHRWPFSSSWSQVPVAFSFHASAFLGVTECKCPAIDQGTLERCQDKDSKPENLPPCYYSTQRENLWTLSEPHGSGPTAPRGQGEVVQTRTWFHQTGYLPCLQSSTTLLSQSLWLMTTEVYMADVIMAFVLTPEHPDLMSFPGTFQTLPCTRTFTSAISSAWSVAAFHRPDTFQGVAHRAAFTILFIVGLTFTL